MCLLHQSYSAECDCSRKLLIFTNNFTGYITDSFLVNVKLILWWDWNCGIDLFTLYLRLCRVCSILCLWFWWILLILLILLSNILLTDTICCILWPGITAMMTRYQDITVLHSTESCQWLTTTPYIHQCYHSLAVLTLCHWLMFWLVEGWSTRVLIGGLLWRH